MMVMSLGTINVDASGNVTIVTQGEGVNTSTIPGFSPEIMAKLNATFGVALVSEHRCKKSSECKEYY